MANPEIVRGLDKIAALERADLEIAVSAVALSTFQQEILKALRAGFWDMLLLTSTLISELVQCGDHERAAEVMAERAAVVDRVYDAICGPDLKN